ncbi:MAG: hypothetical protein ACREFH_03810 [Stellaceae bacterium]
MTLPPLGESYRAAKVGTTVGAPQPTAGPTFGVKTSLTYPALQG